MERVSAHLKLYDRGGSYDGYTARYPGLVQFLGACFHQDWTDEYGADWRAPVRELAAASTREESDGVRRELDLLLKEIERERRDDAEVVRILYHGLGCECFPDAGASAAKWISAVAEAVRAASAPPPSAAPSPRPASGGTAQDRAAGASRASPPRAGGHGGAEDGPPFTLVQLLAVVAAVAIALVLLF